MIFDDLLMYFVANMNINKSRWRYLLPCQWFSAVKIKSGVLGVNCAGCLKDGSGIGL